MAWYLIKHTDFT